MPKPKRIQINRPPDVCFACRASSNGRCVKHDDGSRNDDLVLWEEADNANGDANGWESKFLESTRNQIDQGLPLSEKQRVKLEEIRDKLTEDSSDAT